jgi:chemotaxis protein MotB
MRRRSGGHENHERWLVSYADFITLLFAFFVVMFASTQNDKNKAREVSESVREALEHGQFSQAISTVLGRGRHEAVKELKDANRVDRSENLAPPPGQSKNHPADLTQSMQALKIGLAEELKDSKISLHMEGRGLIVSLRESTFFASGDDAVATASLPILAKVAGVVRILPNQIRLEGYTDAIPIHNSRFHSNWDLSAARAISVMEVLRDGYQIPAWRLAIAGYGENAPVDTNDTQEGRAHNRRVDLVVLSAEGEKAEPQPAPR